MTLRGAAFFLAFSLAFAGAPRASLQKQIDELRAGQAQLLALVKELREHQAAPQKVVSVNVFGETYNGDSRARVAILEYSDFECPYCRRYAAEVYPRLEADYISKGKVRYFFRDLPLPDHPEALSKARFARCAGEQGAFWEMHDWLFANPLPLDSGLSARVLGDLKLDSARFQVCMESGKYEEAIRRSVHSAERLQLNGTPAFLVGTLDEEGSVLRVREVFYGGGSYETFKAVLDGLLDGKS